MSFDDTPAISDAISAFVRDMTEMARELPTGPEDLESDSPFPASIAKTAKLYAQAAYLDPKFARHMEECGSAFLDAHYPGRKFREEREKRQETHLQVSKATGVSVAHVGQFERPPSRLVSKKNGRYFLSFEKRLSLMIHLLWPAAIENLKKEAKEEEQKERYHQAALKAAETKRREKTLYKTAKKITEVKRLKREAAKREAAGK